MKKSVFLLLTFVMILMPLAGVVSAASPAQSKTPIPIAMLVPITGGSATEGGYFQKAIDLAVEQLNAKGGINGQPVNLIKIDNQSSNPGALASLNKAVNEDKVLAIVGPVKSTQILAISDAVKEAGVPMMIGGTNATLTSKGNPWLFRCRPDDSLAAAAMVKYAKEDMKVTKIGILHDSDAFGTGGADGVTKAAGEQGLQIVAREKYTTKDREFTAQLLNLKNAGAEVMVVYGTNPEDVSALQRQYRQLNPGYLYIGSPSSAMKDALNLSKEAANGLLAVTDYVPGQTEEAKLYGTDYKAKYNEEMDGTAAWNYDAFNVLTAAIAKANVDWGAIKDDAAKIKTARDAIRQNILDTQGYKGVLGNFSFSPNGDGLHEVSVVEIQNFQLLLKKVVNIAAAPVAASDTVTTTTK